jgi:hypothetical protein
MRYITLGPSSSQLMVTFSPLSGILLRFFVLLPVQEEVQR